MIGVSLERSRLRISFAVSKPSMPGMRTSSRITAKSFFSARRSASSPDCAIIRFWPRVESSSCSAYRLFGSSSTSRILACDAASAAGSALNSASASTAEFTLSLTYQLVPDRVVDQRGVARQAELAQDAGAVGADRRGREPHLLGDLADLLAGREQPHHAVLAVGELLVERLLRIGGAFARQDFRERGGNVLAAVRHLAHGGGELGGRAFLGDVAGGAAAKHARAVHVLGVHREDQHRLAGELALDVAEEIEAAAAGHGEVEDRHVPFQTTRHVERS